MVPEQAEFVAVRTRQEGLGNVSVAIGGDDCRLPYRDGAFDGIVLNLVFEWCGSRLESESHEQAQTRLLEEMVRVLKPGGFLYLATKNRFALRLLLGGADEHMFDMAFGSALPPRLAAWLLKRKGHARPMGKLYSHDALMAKLQRRRAGRGRSRSGPRRKCVSRRTMCPRTPPRCAQARSAPGVASRQRAAR